MFSIIDLPDKDQQETDPLRSFCGSLWARKTPIPELIRRAINHTALR